jgi:hypothetical protein
MAPRLRCSDIDDRVMGIDTRRSHWRDCALYTELLKALRILDPIEAWVPSYNHFSRLAAAPKQETVTNRGRLTGVGMIGPWSVFGWCCVG